MFKNKNFSKELIVASFTRFLNKFRYVVLLFWIVVLGFSVWLGPRFLSNITNNFDPPHGSESFTGNALMQKNFAGEISSSIIVIVAERNDNGNVLDTRFKNFTHSVNSSIVNVSGNALINIEGYYLFDEALMQQHDFDKIVCSVVFPSTPPCNLHAKSTLIAIGVNSERIHNQNKFVQSIQDIIDKKKIEFLDDSFDIRLTGNMVFFRDITLGIAHDMEVMDAFFALPLALFVLICVLKSVRIMIVPLITIVVSIGTSFMIMYPISCQKPVASTAPSFMTSVTLAMSIDYSLFLLCRFKEEIRKEKSTIQAVEVMLHRAGGTCVVSGITLSVCLFANIFLPVDFIATQGMAGGIALLTTLLVNITLSPVILLMFPVFFSNKHSIIGHFICCHWSRLRNRLSQSQPSEINDEKRSLLNKSTISEDSYTNIKDEDTIEVNSIGDLNEENLLKSKWYRLAKSVLRFKLWIITFIVIITIPFAIYSYQFNHLLDLSLITPRDAVSTNAYNSLENQFGAGQLFPFQLIIEMKNNNTVISDPIFNEVRSDVTGLVKALPTTQQSFFEGGGIMFLPGLLKYATAIKVAESLPNIGKQVKALEKRYVSVDGLVTYVDVRIKVDPFGDEGVRWVKKARTYFHNLNNDNSKNVHYTLAGGAAIMMDCEDKIYDTLPVIIGVTLAVVFVLMGLFFRSLLVPIRSVFTLACTLSICYGAATFVYEHNALGWLSVPSLTGTNGVSWLSPVMAFTIVVGLGLDYDVFLLSRIVEFRSKGYSDNDSIVRGMHKTGRIITAAGLIMAIAFLGLLFSSQMALDQIAFYLIIAVLVDTFVIRTLLVPAIMGCIGNYNWFPRKFKEYDYDAIE